MKNTTVFMGTALFATLVVTFLLTPLGFETRPPQAVTLLGKIGLVSLFSAAAINIVSLVFLFLRSRRAALLAAIGPVLFIFPVLTEVAGGFSPYPPSAVIQGLEYVGSGLEVAIFVLALRLISRRA